MDCPTRMGHWNTSPLWIEIRTRLQRGSLVVRHDIEGDRYSWLFRTERNRAVPHV